MDRVPAGGALQAGACVAVIGGGPAGSAFALHVLRWARESSRDIKVVIFEYKDFGKRGPAGCNRCAGILSSRSLQELEGLGLHVPQRLIMGYLQSYLLHLPDGAIEIHQPRPEQKVMSVYRGGGPLHADLSPDVSFDAWLLDQARAAGAEIVSAAVRKVSAGPLMVVETESEGREFDLVVLATGVNGRPPAMVGLPYAPPETETMAQDELARGLHPPVDESGRVHVYVGAKMGLLFGALIPKGDLINVSLLGHRLDDDPIGRFLRLPELEELRESGIRRLCGCHPRVAVSPGGHPFAPRFVAVGDAAVTRLYKDGIGSAFTTARQAAWTAVHLGVSTSAFAHGYAPLCRTIARDNTWGRLLFWVWQRSQSYPALARYWLSVLSFEQALPAQEQRVSIALWDLLTGTGSYGSICRTMLSWHLAGHFSARPAARRG